MQHIQFTLVLCISFILGSFSLADAQEQPFHVEKKGKGDPVILIPGLTCAGEVWDETVEMLQEDYTCHVLTLAGFAGQPAVDLENGFLPVVAEGIMTYIRENELAQPVVIGHSLGGFLAMDLAAKYPSEIGKIVIVDSYPFLAAAQNPMATVESMKPIAERMKAQYMNQTDEAYRAQLRLSLSTMIATQDSLPVAEKWGMDSDRSTASQAMAELYTTDLRGEIAKIESPVLVLGAWIAYQDYGVTKEMIMAGMENQYQLVKDRDIRLSEKGYHFLMWDDREFTLGAIADFLGMEVSFSQQ